MLENFINLKNYNLGGILMFLNVRFVRITPIIIIALALFLVIGCAALYPRPIAPRQPQMPMAPKTASQTIEMVVNTDPVLNFNQVDPIQLRYKSKDSNTSDTTFAVLAFASPGDFTGTGGSLVSDTFYISLAQRGVSIIEREKIKEIMAEQKIARKNSAISAEEAKRIGIIAGADYMLFGAVTEYKSETRDVRLGRFIPEKEIQRYAADHEAYQRSYADYQMAQARYLKEVEQYNQMQMAMLSTAHIYPQSQNPYASQTRAKTLEEWEDEVQNRSGRNALATVASIGITARVINVQTGEIVWVGQGAKRHIQLQEGTQILVNKLVGSILKVPDISPNEHVAK